MKYFLTGMALSLIVGFGLQLIKGWFVRIRYIRDRKRANRDDKWLYEF